MRSPRGRQQAERCLGERAAALADGELGSDARDAALAHLVHCAGCRDEVTGQRTLKARLRDLPDIAPPDGLVSRLSAIGAIGDSGHDDPSRSEFQPLAPRHRVTIAAGPRRLGRSGRVGHLRTQARARRSVRYAVAGGASVLALGVSAFALGGGSAAPTVVPQVDNLTFEHASTTGEIPLGGVPQTVSFHRVLVGAKK